MGLRSGSACQLAHFLVSKPCAVRSLIVSQTKMVTAYGKNGDVQKAIELFEQMPHRNQVSYNAMLSVLLDSGRLGSALQLFEEMPRKNAWSYTSMIAGLSRSGHVREARQLFDSIPPSDRNVFSWTAMISCYAQNNEPHRAVSLFSGLYRELFESKVIPNSYTLSVVLKSCGCIRSLVAVRQIHSLSLKLLDEAGEGSVFAQNALIDVYAKLDCLHDAEHVFNRMKWKDLASRNIMMDAYAHNLLLDQAFKIFNSMNERDTLSWNIMMSGLLEGRRGLEALRLFLSLLRLGHDTKPNLSTYTIILTACATHTMLEFGRQIHGHTVKNSLYPNNIFVSNSLVTMYANCGLMEDSLQVFKEMPKKDVISWNSVIHGLGKNGHAQKALEIAEKALASNNFNGNTFSAILTSCSHGGLVVDGLDYFNSMSRKYGIEPTLDHYICAVDMLGRTGMLKEARDLLRSMPFAANSVAWSTLLNACSIHGSLNIGRVAAQELQMLETDNTKSYLGLANIYCRTETGRESRELLNLLREKGIVKELGSSWVKQIVVYGALWNAVGEPMQQRMQVMTRHSRVHEPEH
ncbi:unnamed protein product [Musa banksii]